MKGREGKVEPLKSTFLNGGKEDSRAVPAEMQYSWGSFDWD